MSLSEMTSDMVEFICPGCGSWIEVVGQPENESMDAFNRTILRLHLRDRCERESDRRRRRRMI